MRSLRPRRSLPFRKARYHGPSLPLRGSPQQVIVMDSDSEIDNEAGGVPLHSPDEGINEGDEDEGMASFPRLGRESNAEEHIEPVFNSIGLWNLEPVQSNQASRWLVRVEGASRLLLLSPNSLRASPTGGGSLTGP